MITSVVVSVLLQAGPVGLVERPGATELIAKRKKRRRRRARKGKKRKKKAVLPTPAPAPEKPAAAPAPEPKPAAPVAAAEEDERPGIATLDLMAVKGVDQAVADLLNDAILTRLRQSKRFSSIIGSSDIAAMLTLEQQKAAVGCDDDSCLAQLGGALGVPYLFQANVGAVGGRVMLNIKVLQVDEARVAFRGTKIFADEGALLDGLNTAIDGAVAGIFGEDPPVSADPPAVAAAGEVKTAQQTVEQRAASSERSARGGMNWMAIGLGLVGAGTASYGYFVHAEDQRSTYQESEKISDHDALRDQVDQANLVMGVGYSLLAGAVVWGLL